jgi:dihydropteroate synthase
MSSAPIGDASAPGDAPTGLEIRGRRIELSRPLLMGIVNATPDSFSDGGRYPTVDARVSLAAELLAAGADVIDVGGQSGITGVPEVDPHEEIDRVLPVIEGIRAIDPTVLISVDTYKPPVAIAALEAGASVINDVSGLLEVDLAGICADAGAGLVIMHNRSKPKVRLTDPHLYEDVTADVVSFVADKIAIAEAHGLPTRRLIVDPGIDFAKTPAQSVTVLREIAALEALGRPVLFALSRKDFIGALTHQPPRERLAGTLATIAHLAGRAGHIYRVHDLAEAAAFLTVLDALSGRADVPDDLDLPVALRREPSPD